MNKSIARRIRRLEYKRLATASDPVYILAELQRDGSFECQYGASKSDAKFKFANEAKLNAWLDTIPNKVVLIDGIGPWYLNEESLKEYLKEQETRNRKEKSAVL